MEKNTYRAVKLPLKHIQVPVEDNPLNYVAMPDYDPFSAAHSISSFLKYYGELFLTVFSVELNIIRLNLLCSHSDQAVRDWHLYDV